jgi:hypothetical protein
VKIRRRREPVGYAAVPLTPDEAQLLVTALREEDRLSRIHFWTHDGSAWSRSNAAAILRTAGIAAALGHPLVPVLAQDLHMYDDCVLTNLQRYAPHSRVTRDFEQLLGRMHALSGMARVHRWRMEWGAAGRQWAGSPPFPPDCERRALLPGGGSDAQ